MKTQTRQKHLALTLLLASQFNFANVWAQSAEYQSDPIRIDGYVQEVEPTDRELEQVKGEITRQKQTIQINKQKSKKYKELGRSTEKLADATEEMIEERAEAQEEIDLYNKKIDCLMNKSNAKDCEQFVKKKEDKVSSKMAAVESEKEVKSEREDVSLRVSAMAGLTSFNGEKEQLESELSVGARLESIQSDQFSFGMGLRYTTLTTNDWQNTYYYGGYYDYYNTFYGAREISYKALSIDVLGKYYFLKPARFNPYFGGGLVFTRTTMKYEDNRNFNPYNYGAYNYQNFGDEEVTRNDIAVELLAGADINITKRFGVNMELSYTRSLGQAIGQTNGANPTNSPDQRRLQDLSDEIIGSNIMSFYAGATFSF